MKKLLSIVILQLLVFGSLILPKQAIGQGTFKCGWSTSCGGNLCCTETNISCNPGYSVPFPSYCEGFGSSQATCSSAPAANCVPLTNILCGGGQINSAIGCIPYADINQFSGFFLRWAIGIGGGIAFLLIIYAGFMVMTSSGNPERLKAGQELLTSAIMGLIMIIFSVFVLKFIGVDILGIL